MEKIDINPAWEAEIKKALENITVLSVTWYTECSIDYENTADCCTFWGLTPKRA